jgi:hypothetical protein
MKIVNSFTLRSAILGGFSFWFPNLLAHVFRRNSFDTADLRIVTLVLPMILFIACAAGARLAHVKVGAIAIRMLLGIWLFGGIFMDLDASFSGGGFSRIGLLGSVFLIAISWVPIYTFIAATYDGSLGALLLATTGLFLAWILPSSGLRLNLKTDARKDGS